MEDKCPTNDGRDYGDYDDYDDHDDYVDLGNPVDGVVANDQTPEDNDDDYENPDVDGVFGKDDEGDYVYDGGFSDLTRPGRRRRRRRSEYEEE